MLLLPLSLLLLLPLLLPLLLLHPLLLPLLLPLFLAPIAVAVSALAVAVARWVVGCFNGHILCCRCPKVISTFRFASFLVPFPLRSIWIQLDLLPIAAEVGATLHLLLLLLLLLVLFCFICLLTLPASALSAAWVMRQASKLSKRINNKSFLPPPFPFSVPPPTPDYAINSECAENFKCNCNF